MDVKRARSIEAKIINRASGFWTKAGDGRSYEYNLEKVPQEIRSYLLSRFNKSSFKSNIVGTRIYVRFPSYH